MKRPKRKPCSTPNGDITIPICLSMALWYLAGFYADHIGPGAHGYHRNEVLESVTGVVNAIHKAKTIINRIPRVS